MKNNEPSKARKTNARTIELPESETERYTIGHLHGRSAYIRNDSSAQMSRFLKANDDHAFVEGFEQGLADSERLYG